MRYSALAVVFLALSTSTYGQAEETADSLAPGAWAQTLVGSLSLTQASYDDWRAGGDNTLAFKLGMDGSAGKTSGKIEQTHTLQLAYGKSKIGDQDARKIDDLLRYVADFVYLVDGPIKPVFNLDARTQFDKGYEYGAESRSLIAQFLAPAYVVEMVGLAYDPEEWLGLRLGVAGKQTIVTEEGLRANYGIDLDKSLKNEAGLNLIALLQKEIVTNVILKSELNVFESLSDASHPDFRLKNLVQMKVNEYLNANLELELFYDRDSWDGIQLRQTLGLGVSASIL